MIGFSEDAELSSAADGPSHDATSAHDTITDGRLDAPAWLAESSAVATLSPSPPATEQPPSRGANLIRAPDQSASGHPSDTGEHAKPGRHEHESELTLGPVTL